MQEYNIVLAELIGGAIISLLLWYFKRCIANMDTKKTERENAEKDLLDRISNLEEAIFEIHTRLDTQIGREQQRLAMEDERLADFNKMHDGIEAMLRDRISQSRRYFVAKGYIPPHEFENIEAMYKSYAAMGGNGVASKAFEDIKNLPFEKPAGVDDNTQSAV